MANLKLLKYGKFHKEDSDNISHWKADTYDVVLSPYDGEILKTEENKPCGNYILIKHILKNGIFYSEICGINSDLIAGSGYKVRKGEQLAKSNDNDVSIKYLDHNKKKMSLSDLDSLLKTDEKDNSKKEEEKKK